MNKYESIDPDGNISPGSSFTQGKSELGKHEIVTVKDIDHPLLKHPIETITFKLPPKGKLTSLTFSKCNFHNLPYITQPQPNSSYNKSVPVRLCHNVWILLIGNNDPIILHQALDGLINSQIKDKSINITIVVSKRDIENHVRTTIGEK